MPPSSPRSILLADCDVYYVQLARMADPEGAGRAELLIVGGSAESRGVVCSATYEVRKYGVRSGMPISRAVRLCPQAMCVPVPRKLCSEKSEEIVEVLQRFAPDVESASPDEAYLDLTTTMQTVYRGRSLEDIAHTIRDAVWKETAIRISMGGGTNKLVAKLAVELAKPRGRAGMACTSSPPVTRRSSSRACRSPSFPASAPSSRSSSPAAGGAR